MNFLELSVALGINMHLPFHQNHYLHLPSSRRVGLGTTWLRNQTRGFGSHDQYKTHNQAYGRKQHAPGVIMKIDEECPQADYPESENHRF